MVKKFLLLIVLFLFASGFSASPTFANNDLSLQSDVPLKMIEIMQEINAVYGSKENFEEIGSLYVDEDGTLNFNFKDIHTDRNQEIIKRVGNIIDSSFLKVHQVQYSASDLERIKDEINQEIIASYPPEVFENFSYCIAVSNKEQQVILQHDGSISEEMISKFTAKYPDIFKEDLGVKVEPATPVPPPEPNKGILNNLGGLLSILNSLLNILNL